MYGTTISTNNSIEINEKNVLMLMLFVLFVL